MVSHVSERVESSAFEELVAYVRRHLPVLLALSYARLGNRADAERVAAETLRRVAERPNVRAEQPLEQRLARVALDLCRAPELAGIEARGVSSAEDADDRLAGIRRCLLGLDHDARQCLLLRHVAGLTEPAMATLRERDAADARESLQRGEATFDVEEQRLLAPALAPGGDPEAQVQRVARLLADARVVPPPVEANHRSRGTAVASVSLVALLLLVSGFALFQAFPDAEPRSFSQERQPVAATHAAPAPVREPRPLPTGGREIDGIVREAGTLKPVTEFAVALPSTAHDAPVFVEMADPRGHFHLANLPTGAVALLVRAEGYVTGSTAVPAARDADSSRLIVSLERAVGFEGQAVDEAGQPLADARVFLGGLPLPYPPEEHTIATSDAQGRFRIDGLPSKRVEVTVARNGHMPATEWVYPGAPVPHRIVLHPGGRLEGTVREEGAPLGNARILASSGLIRTYRAETLSKPDGSFAIEGLPPGRVRIRGEVAEGRRTLAAVDVAEGQTTRLDIDFPALSATVEGVVTVKGRPPQRAQVEARVATGSGEERWGPVVTDNQGWYRLGPLPSGKVRLRVFSISENSRPQRGEVVVELKPDQTLRHDINLQGRGVIEGTLAGMPQGRHARLYVYVGTLDEWEIHPEGLQEAGREAAARQLVRENGPFRFEGLEAGEYTVLAIALTDETVDDVKQAPTASAAVTVGSGAPARAELRLVPQDLR